MKGPARVLIIDDDESIRQFIEMALADDGYEVATASDGSAALEILGSWSPSVILLDMRMPGIDGWRFSRLYRKTPQPRAPIVVLTAARDAAEYAAQIEADAFLAKPFDLGDLLQLLRRLTQG